MGFRLSLAVLAVAALTAASVGAVGVDTDIAVRNGEVVMIGQSVNLVLSGAACLKAQQYETAFIAGFQAATAQAWNTANPFTTIQSDAVFVDPSSVSFTCSSSHRRRRQLSESSSITVLSTISLPSSVSTEAAAAVASLTQAVYTSSQFATDFSITASTVSLSAPMTVSSAARKLTETASAPNYGPNPCTYGPYGSYGTYGTYGYCPPAYSGFTAHSGTWAQIPLTITVNIDGTSPLKCSSLLVSTTVASFVSGLQTQIANSWNTLTGMPTSYYVKQGDVDNGGGAGVAFSVPTCNPTTATTGTITISAFLELPDGSDPTTANQLSGFTSGSNVFANTASSNVNTYVTLSSATGGARRRLNANTASVAAAGATSLTASSSKNNIALGVGLGVGLGVPFLIGCVVAFILIRKRRDSQSIGPAGAAAGPQ